MKQSRTSTFVFVGVFTLFASACSNSPGIPEGGATTGGSTATGGGAGKAGGSGGSGGSQQSGGNGGSSNSGGSAGTGTAGSGGTMPPPNGTGDTPNLRVVAWNGHEAAVSLTFDDGDPSQFQVGPLLDERGIQGTFFVTRNGVEGGGQTSRDGFAALRDAGHEIANHTMTHASSTDGTAAEVTDCDAYLRTQFGIEPSTFAYPNTVVSDTYKNAAAALYVASRNANDSHITLAETPDWHVLPSYFIGDSDAHPASEAIAALDLSLIHI